MPPSPPDGSEQVWKRGGVHLTGSALASGPDGDHRDGPRKRSATVEVMAADEVVVGGGRFGTDAAGFRAMLEFARRFGDRTWAVEGCRGIEPAHRDPARRRRRDRGGRAAEALGPDADVRDRARPQDRRHGRALGRPLVGTRMSGLPPAVEDAGLAVRRLLADRRRSLGVDHTKMVSQPRPLLLELIPGGANKDLSAAQAKALLVKSVPETRSARLGACSPQSWRATWSGSMPASGQRSAVK
jgi:transposase